MKVGPGQPGIKTVAQVYTPGAETEIHWLVLFETPGPFQVVVENPTGAHIEMGILGQVVSDTVVAKFVQMPSM